VYNGLGVFYPKNQVDWVETDRLPGLPEDLGWMYGIVPLDDQRLLVSCSSGLAVFDRKKRHFTQLLAPAPDDPFGLTTSTYEELFKDASGNIWMERHGQGVSFASLQKHKFFSPPEVARASVSALYEDRRGSIWCSTKDNGTYVLDKEKGLFQRHSKLDIQEEPDRAFDLLEMAAFIDDQSGNLWGTSENHFCFWDEKKGAFSFREAYFLGVPNTSTDRLNIVCLLQNGDILAAKGKDIFQLLTSPEKVSLAPWHDLFSHDLQIITAIFQDKKGRIYLSDQTERLLVFNETAGGVQRLAELKNTGVCNGFLEMGDTLVYTATSKGLLKIETKNWRYRLLDEKADGLQNETFYKVLVDKKGLLWLSGTNGLVRYDPLRKRFHRFGKADGLASKGANPNAFMMSSTGEFWLGGKNGLNVFKPEDVQLMTNSPPVRITEILVNDTLFTQKNKGEATSLDLDYRRNTLSFRFAALDFSDPGSNEFYYRLQGFEDDWVYNGTQGFVRYPNLPPGDYVLEVKATNSDGILGENIHRLAIHIRPPFWRTWWFYLLCAMFVSGLIWGWMQYRLQQAVKMERLRVKISSDLHDEVGTLLSGLAMQTEVLELTARTEDKSKLHRIAELSRSAMLSMRDTVWAIDARKDKFENLLDRMREHAEETLTPRNFRFDIAVEGLDLKKSLPVDVRQNLYLIYKEAVTNIAKHSNGDAVEVRLARTGDGFEMRISDNGKVEEKAYKTTGLGLSNMQLRAERLGGVLEVDKTDGYSVLLKMPPPR
jgi:signal transduction histidine kinase/ligand-binding sensor domain-containing protein